MDVAPLVLLDDEPISDIESDGLGLDAFARVIAGAAKGTDGPFTIGGFGDWGHGKTSLLRLARSQLDSTDPAEPIVTVMFNAWQFEHEDHLIVPLVATVVAAVDAKLRAWKPTAAKVADAGREALAKIGWALRAFAYATTLKAKVSIPGLTEVEAGLSAKEAIDRYDHLAAGPDPLLPPTRYWHAFEALEKAAAPDAPGRGPEYKVVVFIDDLDRCLPPQAVKLLESIKLVLAQRGFIFVLGLDRHVVEEHLSYRYRREFHVQMDGRTYLEKIVQLPLALPSHEERFDGLIKKLLERLAQTEESRPVREAVDALRSVLAVGSNYNPRSLVRFINNLIVDRAIWDLVDEPADKETLGLCAVARILREQLGDLLYRELVSSQPLCDAVHAGSVDAEAALLDDSGLRRQSRQERARRGLAQDLDNKPWLRQLLRTVPGESWLAEPESRRQVDGFLVRRNEPQQKAPKTIGDAIREVAGVGPAAALTADVLRRVTALNLSDGEVADADLERLAGLTCLAELHLDRDRVTDAGLRSVAQVGSLNYLSLDGTQVTGAGIPELAALPTLQHLSLARTALTDEALAHVAKLKHLSSLSLDGATGVTDSGVEQLTALPELLQVDLSRTDVTDAGVRHLASIRQLQVLMLAHDVGVADAGLECLTSLTDLRVLNLSQTGVTDAGLQHVGAIRAMQRLYLSGTGVTDDGLGHLAKLSRLRVLDLWRVKVTDEGLKHLGQVSALESLNLRYTQASDIGLAHLRSLARLRELYLTETLVTDEGLKHLRQLKALERLDLAGTHVTDAGLVHLQALRRLQRLDLSGTQVTDGGRARIRAALDDGCTVL